MLGELTRAEIEEVLTRGTLGRIGCHAEGRTYVVPIAYAYDRECVYAHSRDGLKIRTLRANPSVCFEVELVEDLAHWRSVIAWGRYEELRAAEEDRARKFLRSRFATGPLSETALHPVTHEGVELTRSIYFRLRLEEKSGRLER